MALGLRTVTVAGRAARYAEAERIHAGVPEATLVRIPAAGHLPNLENPDAFNQAAPGVPGRAGAAGLNGGTWISV